MENTTKRWDTTGTSLRIATKEHARSEQKHEASDCLEERASCNIANTGA